MFLVHSVHIFYPQYIQLSMYIHTVYALMEIQDEYHCDRCEQATLLETYIRDLEE